MLQKLKQRTEGFTIIEVLIVLAIAGLILLIVFLAVPALQRNSRNTAIRNDAGNILSGISESVSNNSGVLPTDVTCAGNGKVTITNTQDNTTKVRAGTQCAADVTWPAGPGKINIALKKKCTSNTTIATENRSYAALFVVESGSGTNPQQCVDG